MLIRSDNFCLIATQPSDCNYYLVMWQVQRKMEQVHLVGTVCDAYSDIDELGKKGLVGDHSGITFIISPSKLVYRFVTYTYASHTTTLGWF